MQAFFSYSLADLDDFALASHDWSPLHADESYAHRTPYGERIAYGVMEQLTALSALPDRPGYTLSSMTSEFIHPLFPDVEYEVQMLRHNSEESQFRIVWGSQVLVRGTAVFRPGEPLEPKRASAVPPDVERTGREFGAADLHAGMRAGGTYWPVPSALEKWMRRLNLRSKGVGAVQVAALMWQTYTAGMVLPGRHSLCSKLSIQFADSAHVEEAALEYETEVIGYDSRFDRMRASAVLCAQGIQIAESQLYVFVREPAQEITVERMEQALPRSRTLAGKVAVVAGASRGAGAAIALGLALQGATVLALYRKSDEQMARLVEQVPAGAGAIRPFKGDVADRAWCEQLQEQWRVEYGALDMLVINAGLRLLPHGLHSQQWDAMENYIAASCRLAGTPLSVWLRQVADAGGCCAVMSAPCAVEAAQEYPHYTAAKAAIEGLARSAAKQCRSRLLIVRPPRMRTELSNLPLARHQSLLPERMAAALIKRMADTAIPGDYEVLEGVF